MPGEASVQGLGVSPGVAVGNAVRVVLEVPPIPELDDPEAAVRAAVAAAELELSTLAADLRDRGREEGAEVLAAQSLMAADPMLLDGIVSQLSSGAKLDHAITTTAGELQSMLRDLGDAYLAQRADDVGEVAERVRRILAGATTVDLGSFAEPVVLVADTLTAAETAQLDPAVVLGFVTETGGPTSHVVIIARSIGVPAVVGATGLIAASVGATVVAIDGASGEVALDPSDAAVESFTVRAEAHALELQRAAAFHGQRITYADRSVSVPANVASPADLERAIESGADGIGLLRTEFLFLDRDEPPSEDEQYEFYAAAARAFEQPVVIRSFDIGGDKPAPYMQVDAEENPFLGVRGARLYRSQPEAFESQVRAVLRAASHGSVQLMLPMISTIAEITDFRAWIDQIAAQLARDGVEAATPAVGVMIEVPSIALIADAVMPHVDFVSIGSNDLTQYTLAADRTNGALGHLQDPLHPAVLALCARTARSARAAGVSASVCGLAAADPLGAAAFAAMGIDKLSVSARTVNTIKSAVATLDPDRGTAALDAALAADDAEGARAALANWVGV